MQYPVTFWTSSPAFSAAYERRTGDGGGHKKRKKGEKMERHFSGSAEDPKRFKNGGKQIPAREPEKESLEGIPIISGLRPVFFLDGNNDERRIQGIPMYTRRETAGWIREQRRLGNPHGAQQFAQAVARITDLIQSGHGFILPKMTTAHVVAPKDTEHFARFLLGVEKILGSLKRITDRTLEREFNKRHGDYTQPAQKIAPILDESKVATRKRLNRLYNVLKRTHVRSTGTLNILSLLPKAYFNNALEMILGNSLSVEDITSRVAACFLFNAYKARAQRSGEFGRPIQTVLDYSMMPGNN